MVPSLFEELHEDGLGRLRLIDEGFSADFHASNGPRVNAVVVEQALDLQQRGTARAHEELTDACDGVRTMHARGSPQ